MRWLLIAGLMPVVVSWPFVLQPAPSPIPTPSPLLSLENCIDVDLHQIEELRNLLPGGMRLQEMNQESEIPFGLLDEDWQRLHLLESRVPNNSLLKTKLVSAFRLLVTALYQAHGPTNDNIHEGTIANGSSNDDSLLLRPGSFEQYDKNKDEENEAAESDQMESNLPPPTTTTTTTTTITFEHSGPTSLHNRGRPKETHKQLDNDQPDDGQSSYSLDVEPNTDSGKDKGHSPAVEILDNVDKQVTFETTNLNNMDIITTVDGPSQTNEHVPLLPNENNEEITHRLSNNSSDGITTQHSEFPIESDEDPSYNEIQPTENNNPFKTKIDSTDLDDKYVPLSDSNNTLDSQPPYDTEMGPDEGIYSTTLETIHGTLENNNPAKTKIDSTDLDNKYVPLSDTNNTLDSQPPHDTEMGPDEVIYSTTMETIPGTLENNNPVKTKIDSTDLDNKYAPLDSNNTLDPQPPYDTEMGPDEGIYSTTLETIHGTLENNNPAKTKLDSTDLDNKYVSLSDTNNTLDSQPPHDTEMGPDEVIYSTTMETIPGTLENNNPVKTKIDSTDLDNKYVPLSDFNNTLEDSQPPYDTEMGPDEVIYSTTLETIPGTMENNNPVKTKIDSTDLDNKYVPLSDINNTLEDSQPPYDTEMGPDEVIYSSTLETIITSNEYTDKSATTYLPSISHDSLVPSKQWSDSEIDDDNLFSSSSSPPDNELTTAVTHTTTISTTNSSVNDNQSDFKDVSNEIFTTDTKITTISLSDTHSSVYQTQRVDNLANKSSSVYPDTTTNNPVNTLISSESPHNEDSPEFKDSDIDIPTDGSTYDSSFEGTTLTIVPWDSETEDNTFSDRPTNKEISVTYKTTTASSTNQLSTRIDVDDNDIFPETKEIPDQEQYTLPITDYIPPTTTTTAHPTKESFKTFSVIFPKGRENLIPIIPSNELNMYLPNRRPFRPGIPFARNNCKNNNNCVRVHNIEFKDSEDTSMYVISRLQGSRERMAKFRNKIYTEHSDSENGYW